MADGTPTLALALALTLTLATNPDLILTFTFTLALTLTLGLTLTLTLTLTTHPHPHQVCRPSTDELLCGARDLGAYLQRGDWPREIAPAVGLASVTAHVVHVPHNKCPEVEMAMENLCE